MAFDFHAAAARGDAYLDHVALDPRDRFHFSGPPPSSSALSPVLMAPARPSPPAWPPALPLASLSVPALQPSPVAVAPSSLSSSASQPPPLPRPQDASSQPQSPSHSASSQSPQQQTHHNHHHHHHSPFQPAVSHPATNALLTDWSLHQHQLLHETAPLIGFSPFSSAFPPQPLDFAATTQAFPIDSMFSTISPVDDSSPPSMPLGVGGVGMANWQDFETSLQLSNLGSHSPTGTYLEVLSLPSSNGDNGWASVDVYPNFDAYQQSQSPSGAIFNPGQTLHLRTHSDSASSDACNSFDLGSFEDVSFPYTSPLSPDSDTNESTHRNCFGPDGHHQHAHELVVSPAAAASPMPIRSSSASAAAAPPPLPLPQHHPLPHHRPSQSSGSGMSAGSSSPPQQRRNSGPRKSPITKATKNVIRRSSTGKKDGAAERRVGRRRGPLLPEQRKQASEIRKLRACLRCKFLKKTCDKGEPCAGCQPSHARLWQVPCTRIDIKDIGYFMKDWKADYERHMGRGVSVYNVKGFAAEESLLWVTHGYGFCLPVKVREVFVADDSCFQVDWVESHIPDIDPIDFGIRTDRLDVGAEGVRIDALSQYLDQHIDLGFEHFINDHFEGTPFVTEMLKTAHRYYVKEKLPILRKALKLVLAYNLTLHITLVQSHGAEEYMEGRVDDEDSKFHNKTVAPVMINFQIKCALADMWRELQKDVLEELSSLYSSVYSGDRLKNWPTIFMLASILLTVWEEMQFDCHYRVPDPAVVNKFCNDMESTPVGVVVGLFHAISQKLPPFIDWDSKKHGQLLNNNEAVCDAMMEMRDHITKHEDYLRTRHTAKFDRFDFDSLSNKFLSKLVIRAN